MTAIATLFVCKDCSYSLPFRRGGFCPSCGSIIEDTVTKPAPKKATKKPSKKVKS